MDVLTLQNELHEDWKNLQKPWIPFVGTALFHFTIFTGQLSRYMDGIDGLLTWPIIFCALGGMWDNYRLYKGTRYGEAGLSDNITHIRYIFRMVLIPLLFIPLSYMIGEMTSIWFLSVIGRVASVAFLVHGFNEFVIQVAGHYVVVSEYGVTRHTVSSKMRNSAIRLPVVIVSVGGIIAGLAAFKTHNAAITVFIQVMCVVARFAAPMCPRYSVATTRAIEAVFLYTFVYIQGLVF